MTSSAYEHWIYTQLNPEDNQPTGKPLKSSGVYIQPFRTKEEEPTQAEKLEIERAHLAQYGIYF